MIWANDIKGPWSKPIDLKVSGIDPGHIADQEGNRYLYVDKGEVIRLTDDGLATIGPKTESVRRLAISQSLGNGMYVSGIAEAELP